MIEANDEHSAAFHNTPPAPERSNFTKSQNVNSILRDPSLRQSAKDLEPRTWNTAATQLSWDDLRIVKTLIDCKSRSAAADKLDLNVSTVTRRVAQVERILGITLFNRRRSGHTLTAEGLELRALCERVELDIVSVARRVSRTMQGSLGKLRLTTSDSLLLYFLTPIIAEFKARHAAMAIEVFVCNDALNLARDESDIAFRATTKPSENLVGRRLATIAWAPYGRAAGFPCKIPTTDELYVQAWVSYTAHLSGLRAFQYIENKVAPQNILYRADSVAAVSAAIAAGIGLGFLPCMLGDSTPGLMRVGPAVPELSDELWLLTHSDICRSQRVQSFMAFCAAAVAKQKPLIEGHRPIPGRGF